MTIKIKIIEEFSNEKKFAKNVENYLNSIDFEYILHYAVSISEKGFLYSALIIQKYRDA